MAASKGRPSITSNGRMSFSGSPRPEQKGAPVLKSTRIITLIILIMFASVASVASSDARAEKWTVRITGGSVEAERVAKENGCKNLGPVTGFKDVYLFEKHLNSVAAHRQKRALEAHPLVEWVDRQTPLERVKRDGFRLSKPLKQLMRQPASSSVSSAASSSRQHHHVVSAVSATQPLGKKVSAPELGPMPKKPFNDELWSHQWYLQDNANVAQLQGEIELKVEDVWRMGFTGAGVVVTILDDGLEWNHTDIVQNYDPRASWDMNNNRSDPFPRYDSLDSNSHGTRCAGEVAMAANNRKCGVGIAPRARIGGIKCLDGEINDHIEGQSLMYNIDYIDIYSGSWGPSDDGTKLEGPKRLAKEALELGVTQGRKGKGVLYVWANGNGGALGDNCNCDGYANSIYTISVGGVTQQGQIPFYGERCSSTLAVTCSSGAYTDRKIVTTDLHNKCTIDYTGTSAAAPLAAGIFALVLEANSNLTWRDAQHLTVWTSNPIPLRDNPGWKRNAAGLMFNSRFGFGLLNAKAMVEAALKWQTVPKKSICVITSSTLMPVPLQSRNMVQAVFVSDGCQRDFEQKQQFKMQQQQAANQLQGHFKQARTAQTKQQAGPSPVIYLEHVQLEIDLEYSSRGAVDIFLVSPAGTVSTLLARRPLDVSTRGFTKWPMMSVHFWAESSIGTWTLIVRDKNGRNNHGWLRNATLKLHGTSVRPRHAQKVRRYEGETEVQPFIDPVLELNEDDIYDLNTFPNEMALVKDDSFEPTFIKSVVAMEASARD